MRWLDAVVCLAGCLCKEVEEEVMERSAATSRAANRVLISSLVQYLKLGGAMVNFKSKTEVSTSNK